MQRTKSSYLVIMRLHMQVKYVTLTELEDKSKRSQQKCAEKPGSEFGLGGLLHAIPFFPEESEEMAPEGHWKRKQKSRKNVFPY